MMLKIYPIMWSLAEIDTDNTILDVDNAFATTKISDIQHAKHMISTIDNGQYSGGNNFIDQFGDKLPLTDISTGCKAAILVNEFPDKKILLFECGANAIAEIIKKCRLGNVIIYNPLSGIYDESVADTVIDAEVDNYRFTSLDRLSFYFREERPHKPDMALRGVEYA